VNALEAGQKARREAESARNLLQDAARGFLDADDPDLARLALEAREAVEEVVRMSSPFR
jgi:phage shock protein A